MNAQQLNGTWYNELGSVLTIGLQGNLISGTYQTAVGNAQGQYELTGLALLDDPDSEALGFVVVWQNQYGNAHSATSWSGQFQQDDHGDQVIVTTWLLTSETGFDDDWMSTMVGKDVFTRTEPKQQQIDERKNKGQIFSHPLNKLK